MTPAERFVVVAGASLLVFNFIIFSLCLSIVIDSKAVRNDTAQLIALTGRLLENQLTGSKQPETERSQEVKSAEGCPLHQGNTSPTTFQPEIPVTQDVTEMALSTESDFEELSDEQKRIKSMEERINTLEKTVEDLLKLRDGETTAPSAKLRRRRNGGESLLLS